MLPFRDLGPVEVTWDPDGTPVTLSPFFGTVNLKSELQVADVKEDGQGDIPVDAVDIGRLVTLEIPMTRSSLTQLEKAIHGSTKTSTNLQVPNKVGNTLYALSKEIILKPMVDNVASVTTTEWIHIFKCYPIEKIEVGFDNANQRVLIVEFKVFPDRASGNVGELYRVGPA